MKYPRYRVATVTGFNIGTHWGRRASTKQPTTSATVCDSFYGWQPLRTYRAEDRKVIERKADGAYIGSRPIGNEEAIRRAEDHAAYLNKLWRAECHREDVRRYRG